MILKLQCNRLHILLLATSLLPLCGCSTPATPTSATASASKTVAPVNPGRGIWFWESAAQMAIVANPSSQAQAIANLQAWNVTAVYGSYDSQIASNPAAVRAWNANLAANGIQSYVLASEGDFFLPEQWPVTQAWIQTNFLDFNAASAPGQGFVGLAFDVEPASFTGNTTRVSWNAATPAVRRTYLTYFNNMLQSSRTLLNDNFSTSSLIQTYLVNWFSTLNASIAWASENDRDQWFAQLAQICDRVSVEEYDTNSTATIVSQFQTNNALLAGKSRAALNSGDTVWSTPAQFWLGVTATEAQTGTFVDIEDYDTTAN
jgi:hypothetical protein